MSRKLETGYAVFRAGYWIVAPTFFLAEMINGEAKATKIRKIEYRIIGRPKTRQQ